ncbi:hypothetical protein SLS60_010411 [Paraconiothyrium brasiliense]|uniref:Uncharacterized protein n=1 Tax=Paraconiothyrium brasiliense TaxID=300254 RepID=A0ABR3QNF7_9PLEO
MQVFAKPRTPKTSAHAKSDAQKEYLSFIIRSAAKGVNGLIFGATFTYHFPTRYMYAFIHIYEMPPYIDVIPSLASSLSSPNSTPFLIPLFLLHVDTEQRYKFITNAHATLFSLEIQAGVRESSHDTEGTDFSALSKDLSYFIGNLSLVDWACKTMTRQLEFIGEVKKKYRTQATLSGIKGEEIENTMCVMEEGLDSLGCLNKSIQEQTECLSQRAQALIQTVYSGIAQRDAALSQLAANAAARDSAIMRVIAAITMFFLPATTVAVRFLSLLSPRLANVEDRPSSPPLSSTFKSHATSKFTPGGYGYTG